MNKERLLFILTMVIFGTIGLVRKYIPLPSSMVALCRAGIGTVILYLFMFLNKQKINTDHIHKNILFLIPSGILLGFNWILLFEAYTYTSIAIGTLCYYMAPILVMIISILFLKIKVSRKQIICILIALTGMILVSNVLNSSFSSSQFKGILFGLASAFFYALIMILNSRIKGISAYDQTIVQLGISTIILIPYVLLTEKISTFTYTTTTVLFLLIAGIIHTGIAYLLYFGSISQIDLQSAALMSYIDPMVAIFISILLGEKITAIQLIGAILILGSSLYNELQN